MNEIQEQILSLVKKANPDNPMSYVHEIVQSYSCEKLNSHITSCKDCEICDSVKSMVIGNPNASVMIIGDCASNEDQDDLFVHPFDNGSLEVLNKIFTQLNINTNELIYINAVSCWPYKKIDDKIVKRVPTKAEVQNCAPFVYYAIDIVRPNVIITMGNIALNLFKKEPISKSRGQWFMINNIDTMPTYHPAYFAEIEGKKTEEEIDNLKWQFYDDIRRAFLFIQEHWPNSNVFLESDNNR